MAKRTVAIYARVSTEHEAQLSALENQVQYYDNILSMHPEWEVYDRYIDEGITGTSVKKRKRFMEMMEDAENGCFDLIITREVSRFARNTVDTLQETRKLRRMGVEVYFTEDNIWTLNDEDGELRLTIMATLAQNESKKTSLRVKAGQMVSFQNGVLYGNGNILGYDRVGRELIINPEQAETVRLIYQLYLDGYGARKIQFELERMKRKTSTGLTNWSPSNISRVLRNPFYCGIIEYRKQYVPDYLEQKKINNFGDVERIQVEGTHEPIISKEMFEEVQKKLDSNIRSTSNRGSRGKNSMKCIWGKKLVCACGHAFYRRVWRRLEGDKTQYCYQCSDQIRTGTIKTRKNKGLSIEDICDIPAVQDWKLELMAKLIFQSLWSDKSNVISIANQLLKESMREMSQVDNSAEIHRLNNTLERHKRSIDNLLDMRLAEEIDKDSYQRKRKELCEKVEEVELQIRSLESANDISEDDITKRIKAIQLAMEQDFDFEGHNVPEEIIEAFVKKVTVYKDSFVWELNFPDDKIKCLASGTRSNPKVELIDAPTNKDSSTGSNR